MYRLTIEPTQHQDDRIVLTPQQQHYLKRVLRLKDNDRFIAMDGRGQSWMARLEGSIARFLELIEESTELPVSVSLMIALPKGNGFDDIVRGCTELGVTKLIPIITQRTLSDPSPQKLERWRKIATEAAEQSERQYIPILEKPLSLTEALTKVDDLETTCYICVTRREVNHLLQVLQTPRLKNILIAIGPEGGWTTEEIDLALSVGFVPVSLGSRILRTITAPLVALSIVAAVLES